MCIFFSPTLPGLAFCCSPSKSYGAARASKRRQGARATALLSIYIVVLWGLWVLSLDGLLWIGIYALLLPRLLTLTGQATASVVQRQGISDPENSFRAVMIVRGARALVILLAVLWLGLIWRLNPSALTESDSPASRIMRGVLHGAIILLVADLIWHLAKAYIGRKLEIGDGGRHAQSGGDGAPGSLADIAADFPKHARRRDCHRGRPHRSCPDWACK